MVKESASEAAPTRRAGSALHCPAGKWPTANVRWRTLRPGDARPRPPPRSDPPWDGFRTSRFRRCLRGDPGAARSSRSGRSFQRAGSVLPTRSEGLHPHARTPIQSRRLTPCAHRSHLAGCSRLRSRYSHAPASFCSTRLRYASKRRCGEQDRASSVSRIIFRSRAKHVQAQPPRHLPWNANGS